MIRESNFELLRIVAILMIIGLHYLNGTMGGALVILQPGDANYYFAYWLESFSIIAVNLFILITGYFMNQRMKIDFYKLLKLILLSYFYSVFFYVMSVILGFQTFSVASLYSSINLSLSGGYWFIKYYVILVVLIPFINVALNSINKKSLMFLVGFMFIIFSIWPSYFSGAPVLSAGYDLTHLIFMYVIGATLSKYGQFNKSRLFYLGIYVLCGLIVTHYATINLTNEWNYNFVFNVIGAVALFIVFAKTNITLPKVNYLSSFTFAVYIIHFNPVMIEIVYKKLLQCDEFYYSNLFVVHFFISVMSIYLISVLIEYVRRFVFRLIEKMMIRNRVSAIKELKQRLLVEIK